MLLKLFKLLYNSETEEMGYLSVSRETDRHALDAVCTKEIP